MYVNCAIQAHATQPVPPALLAVPAACRLDHCIGITQGSGRRGLPHLLHCPRLLVAQFVPWGALCRISRRVAGQIGFVAPVFMFACTIAYIWRCSYRCAWQRNRLSRTPFNNDGKMNRPTIPTINFFVAHGKTAQYWSNYLAWPWADIWLQLPLTLLVRAVSLPCRPLLSAPGASARCTWHICERYGCAPCCCSTLNFRQ